MLETLLLQGYCIASVLQSELGPHETEISLVRSWGWDRMSDVSTADLSYFLGSPL